MAKHIFAPEVLVFKSDENTTVNTVTKPFAALAAENAFTVWSDVSGGSEYTTLLTALDGVTPLTAIADASGATPWLSGPDDVQVMYLDAGSGTRIPIYAVDTRTDMLTSGARLNVEQTWPAAQHFDAITTPDGALPIAAIQGLAQGISDAASEGIQAQNLVNTITVRTVNNVGPDAIGNVTVAGGGGGSGTVTSVAGNLPDGGGNVTLTPSSVGLGNVSNLTSANLPLSDAAVTALAGKLAATELTQGEAQSTSSSVLKAVSGRRLFDAFVQHFVTFGQYYTVYYNGTTWPALSTVNATYIATGRPIIWDSQTYLGAAEPSEARNGDLWDKKIA